MYIMHNCASWVNGKPAYLKEPLIIWALHLYTPREWAIDVPLTSSTFSSCINSRFFWTCNHQTELVNHSILSKARSYYPTVLCMCKKQKMSGVFLFSPIHRLMLELCMQSIWSVCRLSLHELLPIICLSEEEGQKHTLHKYAIGDLNWWCCSS